MVSIDQLQGRFIFFDSFSPNNRFYIGGCVVLDVIPAQDSGVVAFFGPGNRFVHTRLGLYSLQNKAENTTFDYDQEIAWSAIKYIFEKEFL